jgi:malonyl-CoA O-methyltransferase
MNACKQIKRTFNRADLSYDQNCQLQQQVGNTLIHYVQSQVTSTKNMLDLGCGTGIVTEVLAASLTSSNFQAIDIADRFVRIAQSRLAPYSIQVHEADFDNLSYSPSSFDFIFSNMALHWSKDILLLLHKLAAVCRKNGVIAFSIPLPGTLHELQPWYAVNTLIEANIIQKQLLDCGYECVFHIKEQIHLPVYNTLHALRLLKNTGATYVHQRIHSGLKGKSLLDQIDLQQLTYHIGYFIARVQA